MINHAPSWLPHLVSFPRQGEETSRREEMSLLAMTHPRRSRLREQKSLHVLVIEDEAGIRESLAALLERDGHRVDLAEDGVEGVEKAVSLRPQVALVDI